MSPRTNASLSENDPQSHKPVILKWPHNKMATPPPTLPGNKMISPKLKGEMFGARVIKGLHKYSTELVLV